MLIERRADSISGLIEMVGEIRRELAGAATTEEFWYRGQAQRSWTLVPELHRPECARLDESSLVERFVSIATPLAVPRPATAWEWYFLARHHGLPSRLLDWTENLLTAAHFALCHRVHTVAPAQPEALHGESLESDYDESSPAVWVLEAGSLNVASGREDDIVTPDDDASPPYLPERIKQENEANLKPIAILPVRTNPRIIAQQGVFTLHGREPRAIDDYAYCADQPKLGCVLLDRSKIRRLWIELHSVGVHRFNLFPDLDHAAKHVRWLYDPDSPAEEP